MAKEKEYFPENKKDLKSGRKIEQTSNQEQKFSFPEGSQLPHDSQVLRETTLNSKLRQDVLKNLRKIKTEKIQPREFLLKLKAAFCLEKIENSVYIKNKINNQHFELRLSNHSANSYFSPKKTTETSIVIKLSEHDFVDHKKRLVKEFVYYPKNLTKEIRDNIIKGLTDWVNTGNYSYEHADKINLTSDLQQQLSLQKRNVALETHHVLKEDETRNLSIVTQEEFNRIVDALYREPKPNYKNIPNIIRLPAINAKLAKKLGVENANFFLKANVAHVRPERKSGYNQDLRIEEMKGMLDFIRNANTAYIDSDERHKNFMLVGFDSKDKAKANKIVFNQDELGNYIVTIGKINSRNLGEKEYSKVAVGVEPTIWGEYEIPPIATMLRSSTTLPLDTNISQNEEKSINIQGEKTMTPEKQIIAEIGFADGEIRQYEDSVPFLKDLNEATRENAYDTTFRVYADSDELKQKAADVKLDNYDPIEAAERMHNGYEWNDVEHEAVQFTQSAEGRRLLKDAENGRLTMLDARDILDAVEKNGMTLRYDPLPNSYVVDGWTAADGEKLDNYVVSMSELKRLAGIEISKNSQQNQIQEKETVRTPEEEQAYQEWQEMLEDNQQAEDRMERMQGIPPEERPVIESLYEIGNAMQKNSTMVLKSPTFGDVTFSNGVFGDLSKKNNGGYGINHIVEGRYVKDGLSNQDIASLLYLVKDTVETTKVEIDESKSRQNIVKDGIWVTLRKDFDGVKQNWVVTGFAENDGNGQMTKEAADAIKAVNARYGYAPEHLFVSEQVGAAIASVNTIAQNILKSSDKERIENFKSVYANTKFLEENLAMAQETIPQSAPLPEWQQRLNATINQAAEMDGVKNSIKAALYDNAETFTDVPFSREGYERLFQDGVVQSPLETIHFADNQFDVKDQEKFMLAAYQTLSNPDLIYAESENQDNLESRNYVKTFVFGDDEKSALDIVVKTIGGQKVMISAQKRSLEDLIDRIKQPEQLVYMSEEIKQAIDRRSPEEKQRLKDVLPKLRIVPENTAYDKETAIATARNFAVEKRNVALEKKSIDERFDILISYEDKFIKTEKENLPSEITQQIKDVERQIEEYWYDGTIPKNARFTLPTTQTLAKQLGCNTAEISIPVAVIKKARDVHNFSALDIKKSLTQLYNPVIVFDSDKSKSESKADSRLILTDSFKYEYDDNKAVRDVKPIAFAVNVDSTVDLNNRGLTIEVQDVRSIHDRTLVAKNGTDLIQEWTKKGLCRSIDDKKIGEWSTVAGIYFPLELLNSPKNNILTKTEIVNSFESEKRNVALEAEQKPEHNSSSREREAYDRKYPTDWQIYTKELTDRLNAVSLQIENYLKYGTLPENSRFILPNSPQFLQKIGSHDTQISLPVAVVKKAHETHGLTLTEIQDAVKKLYNPVLAFDSDKSKSENKADSRLLLTDSFTKENKPVALAINVNSNVKLIDSNISAEVQDIRSIHDRTLIAKNGTDLIKKWTQDGLCRYVDEKKISDWSSLARVYFPIELLQSPKNNILTKTEIVNSLGKEFRNPDTKKISDWSTVAGIYFPIEAHQSPKNNILTKTEIVNSFESEKRNVAIEDEKIQKEELRATMQHTNAWPENFPSVYAHSLYYGDSVNGKEYANNVKTALLVGKAKRGDRDAAISLVSEMVNPDVIKELHAKYPDAIVCAVDGLEASGHNMIPIAYKNFLGDNGFSIDNEIIQDAKAHHTGADRLDKLLNRVRFHGEVQKEKEYILLDDHIAMGSTLRDLRDYIESNGGKVVAVTTLTAPEKDYRISVSKENLENLNKYGGAVNELLREYGITDNIKGLTDREAKEIVGVLSDRGRAGENQKGIRGSFCLHARKIQEDYLLNASRQSVKPVQKENAPQPSLAQDIIERERRKEKWRASHGKALPTDKKDLATEQKKPESKQHSPQKSSAKDYIRRVSEQFLKDIEQGSVPFMRGEEVGDNILIKVKAVRNAVNGRALTGFQQLLAQDMINKLVEKGALKRMEHELVTYEQAKECGTFIKKGSPHIILPVYNEKTNEASLQIYYFKSGCKEPEKIELANDKVRREAYIKRLRVRLSNAEKERMLTQNEKDELYNMIANAHQAILVYMEAMHQNVSVYRSSLPKHEQEALRKVEELEKNKVKKTKEESFQELIKESMERRHRMEDEEARRQEEKPIYFDARKTASYESYLGTVMAAATVDGNVVASKDVINTVVQTLTPVMRQAFNQFDYMKGFDIGKIMNSKCKENLRDYRRNSIDNLQKSQAMEKVLAFQQGGQMSPPDRNAVEVETYSM